MVIEAALLGSRKMDSSLTEGVKSLRITKYLRGELPHNALVIRVELHQ